MKIQLTHQKKKKMSVLIIIFLSSSNTWYCCYFYSSSSLPSDDADCISLLFLVLAPLCIAFSLSRVLLYVGIIDKQQLHFVRLGEDATVVQDVADDEDGPPF